MNDVIRKIKDGNQVAEIFSVVLQNIYERGAVSSTDMEILSLINLYHKDLFNSQLDKVLNYLSLFYKKDIAIGSLKELVFRLYGETIEDIFHERFTPVQADIMGASQLKKYFSFSAPTSTGKSFVLNHLIDSCIHDVVIVVPSRALINEYYYKLCDAIPDKSVNILTFVDRINTAHCKKNIFVVTPERCRELFKFEQKFDIDLFLFDEAQLGDGLNKRGLYFDSIVRRCQRAYPESKFVFAHPFVVNPEAQFIKNSFDLNDSANSVYSQKNVGQYFMSVENGIFYHFGINKEVMGNRKIRYDGDPVKKAIEDGGTVLIYVSKASILGKSFLRDFKKYISLCPVIHDRKVKHYIQLLKEYTGGSDKFGHNRYSLFLWLLQRGIVVHHGSLPLKARLVMEEFTKTGYCKLCFATSTLEQGINMPFDVVYLNRFEGHDPLGVKNLIGRAGRSTKEHKFDQGCIIIKQSNVSNFRKIFMNPVELKTVSALENSSIGKEDGYEDFKEAIIQGTFDDEYNLTQNELVKLQREDTDKIIEKMLYYMFQGGDFIKSSAVDFDKGERWKNLKESFFSFYENYLNRELSVGEKSVLNTALRIVVWRVNGLTFKSICQRRYAYASCQKEREKYAAHGGDSNIKAKFTPEYQEFPDKNMRPVNLFPDMLARDVDYDTLIYDTYDYLDKLIGYRLSDVMYAAFYKYFERHNDSQALIAAKMIKYGSSNEREIWMLRYGMTFEDIQLLNSFITHIDERGLQVTPEFSDLKEEEKKSILRFVQ